MKQIIFIFIFISALVGASTLGGYFYIHHHYNQIINQGQSSSWFSVSNYSRKLLVPEQEEKLEINIPNENLWKQFHFSNVLLPLPYNNPFYSTLPIMNYSKKTERTQLGVKIITPKGKGLLDIYFLPMSNFIRRLYNQKIFELPIVEKILLQKSSDRLWKDIFTLDISKLPLDMSFEDMAYHLYILYLRTKVFPEQMKSFSYLDSRKAGIINLENKDKNFSNQILIFRRGAQLFPFLLRTSNIELDSDRIRSLIKLKMSFRESTPSLVDIIYTEFRSLSFQDQSGVNGVNYLFSAWTHDISRRELIDEAVLRLEKGRFNAPLLKILYRYMYDRYQAVYNSKYLKELGLKGNFRLDFLIKKEKEQKEKELLRKKYVPPKEKKETFEDVINKAKRIKSKSKSFHIQN